MFTVAYVYRGDLIHYVSFVYEPFSRRLHAFDPGYNLYLYGKHKIIPMVATAFRDRDLIDTFIDVIPHGRCTHSSFGVQYDGRSPCKVLLPADVFCQTWTLFFLVSWIREKGNLAFFRRWCRVDPPKRKTYLIRTFVRPLVASHVIAPLDCLQNNYSI
jgi:hypothetical protein